jgi:NAD(P)-dependent dehydrogenase (short-subunit alcohol dehydrogenase family)
MANLLFTMELAHRLQNSGVTVNAVHPGLVRSNLMNESFAPLRWLTWLLSSPPNRAAMQIARLATDPQFVSTTGKFLHDGKEIQADPYALDPENQRRLWELSEKLTDARDVLERGANYDPTGSVAMFNDESIPEEIIRPEDNRTNPGH